jgi:hypothetical protein
VEATRVAAEQEKADLEARLQQANDIARAVQEQAERDRTELAAAKKARQEWEEEKNDIEETLTRVRKDATENAREKERIADTLKEAQKVAAERDAACKRVEEELGDARREADESQQACSRSDSETRAEKARVARAEQELAQSKAQLASISTDRARIQSELDQTRLENEQLLVKMRKTAEEHASNSLAINDLQSELDELKKSDSGTIQKQIDERKQATNELRDLIQQQSELAGRLDRVVELEEKAKLAPYADEWIKFQQAMMGGVEAKLKGTPEKPGKPSTIKNAEEVHAHILHIVSNMIPSASNRGDTITRKATDLQHYVKDTLIPLLKKASKTVGIAPLSATSSAASRAPVSMPYRPTELLSKPVPAYPPPRPTTASSLISAQLRQLEQEGQQAPVEKPSIGSRLGGIPASAATAAARAGPRLEDVMSNASPQRVRPSSAIPAAAFRSTATTRPSTALPRDAAVAPFRKQAWEGGYHLTRRRSKKRNRSTRRRTPRKHKARRR